MKKKRIILLVTNDLQSDQRVHKMAETLHQLDFDVLLVGRKLKVSAELENRLYRTKRMKLIFSRTAFFYIEYMIRTFFLLLFSRFDVVHANDTDTILPAYFSAFLKRKKLVFDAHELFPEVPELIDRHKVKKIWEDIEAFIFPRLKYTITVCDSISDYYHKKYGIKMLVIRNLPKLKKKCNKQKVRQAKRIIYQGTLNKARGLENAIEAMQYVENVQFDIYGDGDLKSDLENLVKQLNITDRVSFKGRIPFDQLHKHTCSYDLGLSIEQDMGLSYHFALPNKIFDYIQANIPVLVSNLPEMMNIIEAYKLGTVLKSHNPQKIAKQIRQILADEKQLAEWKQNAKIAAQTLIWENEIQKLEQLYFILFR